MDDGIIPWNVKEQLQPNSEKYQNLEKLTNFGQFFRSYFSELCSIKFLKMDITPYELKSNTTYPAVTELSKAINELLGDRTGRTVSMRTAQGLKRTFGATEMHEDTAEDIVHVGMVASAALLNSKNDAAKAGGVLLLLGLAWMYQEGKEPMVYV
jgi:3-methyladenine DNA glycosylase Tag